jgi:hypothetical protein
VLEGVHSSLSGKNCANIVVYVVTFYKLDLMG